MANGTIFVYVPIVQARQNYSSNATWRTKANPTANWTNRTNLNFLYFAPTGNRRTCEIVINTNGYSSYDWLAYMFENSFCYETEFSDVDNLPNLTWANMQTWLAENATPISKMPDSITFEITKDNYFEEQGHFTSEFEFTPVEETENAKNYIIAFPFPYYTNYYQRASLGKVYGRITTQGENITGDIVSANYQKPFSTYLPLLRFVANDGYTWDYETLENNLSNTSKYNSYTITPDIDANAITIKCNGVNIPNTGDCSGYDEDTITLTPILQGGYKLNISLTDCTCNYNDGDIIPPETEITMQFTPNAAAIGGYQFKTPPTFSQSGVVVDYNETTGVYTATFTPVEHVTINAIATRYVYLSFNGVAFADCNIDENTKLFVDESYYIEVVANTGYYFDNAPYIAGFSETQFPTEYPFTTDEKGDYPKTWYIENFNGFKNNLTTYSTLRAAAVVVPETDKYGIIKIYNPTATELDTLSLTRIRKFTDGLGGVTYVDLGQYISGLRRLYVNIPEYDRERVILGGYDMGVDSAVVLRDIVQTNCGKVEIAPYFNNVMDYDNTSVKVYLPFRGFETLETAVVMNEEIEIIYRTNVINGDTLILIYGTNERLLYTFECNCSYEVPYIINGQNQINGKLNIDSSYLYGFTPFIEISRDIACNTAIQAAASDIYSKIEALTGYNEITVINLATTATETERNEIINILESGVIV